MARRGSRGGPGRRCWRPLPPLGVLVLLRPLVPAGRAIGRAAEPVAVRVEDVVERVRSAVLRIDREVAGRGRAGQGAVAAAPGVARCRVGATPCPAWLRSSSPGCPCRLGRLARPRWPRSDRRSRGRLGAVRADRRVVRSAGRALVIPGWFRPSQPTQLASWLRLVMVEPSTVPAALGRHLARVGVVVAALAGEDVVEGEVQDVADLVELVGRAGLVVGVVEEALETGVAGRRLAPGRVAGPRLLVAVFGPRGRPLRRRASGSSRSWRNFASGSGRVRTPCGRSRRGRG